MTDSYLNSLLGEDEQIVLVARRHWTVLVGEIASEAVLSLAVLVMVTILIFLPPPVGNPLWALGYVLLIFPAVSLLRDVAVWANQQFVITSRRVIHVQGVLNKDITDSSLEKVNDVKLEQSFLGRLLNFGNIEILTASELGVNKFSSIAEPIKFKTAMLNAKTRLEHGERLAEDRLPPRAPRAPGVPARPAAVPDTASTGLLEHMQAKRAEAAPNTIATTDIPTLLKQLDELRQAGVLTEAEFQNKKAQLLARL